MMKLRKAAARSVKKVGGKLSEDRTNYHEFAEKYDERKWRQDSNIAEEESSDGTEETE